MPNRFMPGDLGRVALRTGERLKFVLSRESARACAGIDGMTSRGELTDVRVKGLQVTAVVGQNFMSSIASSRLAPHLEYFERIDL